MEVFIYCKTQIGFFLIFLFISYLFVKDGNRLNKQTKSKKCNKYFDVLFVLGEVAIVFDGITAYTVNHLVSIPNIVNMLVHLVYLLSYQLFIFFDFLYWLSITDSMPQKKIYKFLLYFPIIIFIIITIAFIPQIYYYQGVYTNYAKGISAYSCYGTIGLYSLLVMILFFFKNNYINQNKRTALIVSLIAICLITLVQLFFNETLVSSMAIVLVILSIYECLEDPTVKYLQQYHNEMIVGFSTLVENKDGSTGGHIHRSSSYVELIAKELRRNSKYYKVISKDYLDNLCKAAPMHDIGKIGIPDSILQKPGKLTLEEFATMKKHPEIGGKIICETFGHLNDNEYKDIAYNVAMYHHEKWNGKGYPKGLSGEQIPLCARIMAVADVFDAVSAKRCYRDAMPLEKCFEIIKDGRGIDFDPDVIDAFLSRKEDVEKIYMSMKEN